MSYLGLKSSAEAAVYRSVFNELKIQSEESTWNGKVAVLSKPSSCSTAIGGDSKWADIPEEVFQKFLAANSYNAEPVKLTSMNGFIPIVSWEDNKRLHRAGYIWKPEDQPVLGLSRVGLNYVLNKAVLCIEKIVPSMLGGFAIVFFVEKENGKWVVKINRTAWVS
ncbi:MAG: hypothetical protein GY829_14970 [Gammaproteobacteria bacterium]|nr:hypothetical protein [Gammaproteobacteria bacterium]